jgi:pimeloyl-ACP methyl ester carboxylesterase
MAPTPKHKIVLSNFTPSRSFLETVATSSLNYRECALQEIMALIAHDPDDSLEEYLATALYYGATESEIQNVVYQSSFHFGPSKAITTRSRVVAGLQSLMGPLHHALNSTYVEKEVSVGDHHTVVKDSNPLSDSVPIVLIHALALDRRMWDAVFSRLVATAGRDMRVIAYDMRGHGYAAHAPHARSLTQLASDLHCILDALKIAKADVYGQSYGGAVAQYFALAHPEQTRCLGLITTAGEAQPSWVTRATRAEEAQSVAPLLPETILRWFTPEGIARNEWGVRYARSCVERISLSDWADAWRCMSQLDSLPSLREGKVKCPVLLVCGVQDASTGPKWMTRLREACEAAGNTQVVYKEIDPGVHMMALEQGEALAGEILAFRQKVDQLGV